MTNKLPKLLAMATFFVAVFTILNTGSASAATINVTTDDVFPAANADGCTLREAIENINDQATTNTDCAAGDGSTDTIIIPAGTILLQADLPQITTSIAIQGAGMGETVIDGAGAWQTFRSSGGSSVTLTIEDLSIQSFMNTGVGADSTNLIIKRVQIDGSSSIGQGSLTGIVVQTQQSISLLVEDTYIHDLTTNDPQLGIVSGIVMFNKSTVEATIRRTTISNISTTSPSNAAAGGIFGLTGLFDGSGAPADFIIDYENITVSNINSVYTVIGVGIAGAASGGTSHTSGSIKNSTITNVSSALGSDPANGGAVAFEAATFTPSDSYVVDMSLQNLLISSPAINNCLFLDATTQFGGTGAATVNATSTGGNLSDDNSCAPYFTQPTDQNNVAGLAATLSALADNGGSVPTMALKQGSPAIDSGITIAGLTTDARGQARPQGSAYDSGAYESPYTKPTLAASGQGITMYLVAVVGLLFAALLSAKRRFAYAGSPR